MALMTRIKLYFLFMLQLCYSAETKPRLTLDEFFDYTEFSSLSLSPTGQHLLIQTIRAEWNSSSYERNLWLYDTQRQNNKLITKGLCEPLQLQWSPGGNWFAFLLKNNSGKNTSNGYRCSLEKPEETEEYIYFYSILSGQLLPVQVGQVVPSAFIWSNNDSSLYFITTRPFATKEDEDLHKAEWKNVIRHQQSKSDQGTTIYRIETDTADWIPPVKRTIVKNVSFPIDELLFAPLEQKLLFISESNVIEKMDNFEIYSLDLRNLSSLSRLTNNEVVESDIKLSNDGRNVLYRAASSSSSQEKSNDTQRRLYSLNLATGQSERLCKDFNGHIIGYTLKSDGGVYILGQLGTEVQIYSQKASMDKTIHQQGQNGSYERLTSASNRNGAIAFIHSAFGIPKEVYFVHDIEQLQSAQAVTSENKLFTERDLPRGKIYQWENDEDHRTIEGILHYPPGKFESKHLPLLVLIHGGPYAANINWLRADWYAWATLAASEGWLVLEPNYRGSTGYGDQFLNEIRPHAISRPGKDILSGVDQLIKDGVADPNRLAVGGYSYGGYLTNWLIMQTTRFNAALSGAGGVEHVSDWGTTDLPVDVTNLFGGLPWEVPHIYHGEGAIYQLDKVRTPTHIVTGENDVRVAPSQSYILERGLHYLGIPVQLLIFPGEGHLLSNNPWHRKIKVREELKWLHKYASRSSITTR